MTLRGVEQSNLDAFGKVAQRQTADPTNTRARAVGCGCRPTFRKRFGGMGMAWRASLGSGQALRKGVEMVVLAGAAVAAAYFIGRAVGAAV